MRFNPQALALLVFGIALVTSGCNAQNSFPENQKIAGPFDILPQWQVINLRTPLKVNREAFQQGLHIVVNSNEFAANSDYDDALSNEPEHFFDLRNVSGDLIVPEVILIAGNGQEVRLGSRSNIYPEKGGLTVGMRMVPDDTYAPSPPYPEGVPAFTSFRIRSNVPFTAEYFWWVVERHPDMLR